MSTLHPCVFLSMIAASLLYWREGEGAQVDFFPPSVHTFLTCFLAFLFIEGFQILDRHYCLSAQPPRQWEPHHHRCCGTKEQKRECQTPPTRSLSHQSPHLTSRWGCLFSGFLSTPRVLQNEAPPTPPHPQSTSQLLVIHLLHSATRLWPGRVPILSHQLVISKSLSLVFFISRPKT